MTPTVRTTTPGWPELIVGLVAYVILLFGFALIMGLVADETAAVQGIVGSTAGAIVGIGAFTLAVALRIRALHPFGFRPADGRWFAIAAALGILGYALNLAIQTAYASLLGVNDPQGILHAAARGGPIPFVASFIGGAVFTPLGEEVLFRGVIANALNRYRAWAGVGMSAVIFGIAHGVSVILPVAIMVGVLTGIMFRATGSVWPCVLLHGLYNGANSVGSALGVVPMQ